MNETERPRSVIISNQHTNLMSQFSFFNEIGIITPLTQTNVRVWTFRVCKDVSFEWNGQKATYYGGRIVELN